MSLSSNEIRLLCSCKDILLNIGVMFRCLQLFVSTVCVLKTSNLVTSEKEYGYINEKIPSEYQTQLPVQIWAEVALRWRCMCYLFDLFGFSPVSLVPPTSSKQASGWTDYDELHE